MEQVKIRLQNISNSDYSEKAVTQALRKNNLESPPGAPAARPACPPPRVCRNGCRRDRSSENGIIGKNYYCDSYKYYYAKCNAGFIKALSFLNQNKR